MAEIRSVNMEQYQLNSNRYELVSGEREGAPLCPYGNHYEWIGYDLEKEEFVRFTKSVFKHLINLRK